MRGSDVELTKDKTFSPSFVIRLRFPATFPVFSGFIRGKVAIEVWVFYRVVHTPEKLPIVIQQLRVSRCYT